MNSKLKELREKPHLSASSLSTFLSCSLQFKFSRIDKIPAKSKSSALLMGSVFHQVMEHFYTALREGEILSCEDLQELFELRLKWLVANSEEISYKTGESYESLFAQGKALLECFSANLPDEDPGTKVLFIEEPFSLELPGLDIPIIGGIDLVLETEDSLIIIDHKTAGKGLSSADIDLLDQLTIYQLAMKDRGYGDKEILLRLDCLIKLKRSPRFEQYWTSRSEADEQRLIRKFQMVHAAIQNGTFVPNDGNWRCGSCAYKSECKAWSMSEAA